MDIKVHTRPVVRVDSLSKSDTFHLLGVIYQVCNLWDDRLVYKGNPGDVLAINLATGNILAVLGNTLVVPVTAELNCYEV
ncbi:ORF.65 [Pseudomonas phage PaP3]|uniref:ORF.65 n=2 Tax=Viruses TaxID=10239 RepID=Q8H9X9_9CAUD|nr:ORF.65 [Pseudomonas phage PaP3]AAL85507.1 ORF.65 [Pseudomonas phage PaP3]